jgi:hypothetical protein
VGRCAELGCCPELQEAVGKVAALVAIVEQLQDRVRFRLMVPVSFCIRNRGHVVNFLG